jgi:hypothetical protein
VLVYGGKKAVEWVAGFLEKEILVEIKRVIHGEDFSEFSDVRIWQETEKDLADAIGRHELIVLADPLNAILMGKELERRYPEQKFAWYGQGVEQMVRKCKRIYILVSSKIRRMELYQRTKARCQEIEIVESDPGEWKEIIEKEDPGKEEIMEKVKLAQGAPIFVFDSGLLFPRVRDVVDWRGEVIDMEKGLLLVIKNRLGLKG